MGGYMSAASRDANQWALEMLVCWFFLQSGELFPSASSLYAKLS